MTQQEIVEREVRMIIGDLTLQLIVTKAKLAELEQEQPQPRANGKDYPTEMGVGPNQ